MISSIRHVLLDIEGTTCPVSFVSDVLFPYAQRQIAAYLQHHEQEASVQALVQELWQAWGAEQDSEAQLLLQTAVSTTEGQSSAASTLRHTQIRGASAQSLVPYLHWLIQCDRKLTALKELQGLIWHEGYQRGDLNATLFGDVIPTLRRWKQLGLGLSVYSSGSVVAQQLLYGHTHAGDMRDLFTHWFDTRIGAKQEAESYRLILKRLECTADQVMFISDAVAELEAASSAGMQVAFSNREGNPQRDPGAFLSISELNQLVLA